MLNKNIGFREEGKFAVPDANLVRRFVTLAYFDYMETYSRISIYKKRGVPVSLETEVECLSKLNRIVSLLFPYATEFQVKNFKIFNEELTIENLDYYTIEIQKLMKDAGFLKIDSLEETRTVNLEDIIPAVFKEVVSKFPEEFIKEKSESEEENVEEKKEDKDKEGGEDGIDDDTQQCV